MNDTDLRRVGKAEKALFDKICSRGKTMNNEPCSICEEYIADVQCDKSECPVFQMKAENEKLKKRVASLRAEVQRLKSSASWDEDIRRGQVQGMW